MEKQTPKNEGPTCACGKEDLYTVWLKMQENENKGNSESAVVNQTGEHSNSKDGSIEKEKNPASAMGLASVSLEY